jgi:hypothetical protein
MPQLPAVRPRLGKLQTTPLPRYLWCGGGHFHKECPEKNKKDPTPSCCICKLAEGEKPHSSTYRSCSHAKEKIRRRRNLRAPTINTGRTYASKYITQDVSFAEALQSKVDQNQQRQFAAAAPAAMDQKRVQTPGQSVLAPNMVSVPKDNMVMAFTVVQQIMTDLNNTVSMKAKVQAITRIVLTFMEQNGQHIS